MRFKKQIEQITGRRVKSTRALHGGSIAKVYVVELANGKRLVAKVAQPDSMMSREGYMLNYLKEVSNLPVPDVIYSDDTLLLMTHIEGNSSFGAAEQTDAAEILAELHENTAERFGLEEDTLIGPLHQPNPRTDTWLEFFREHRLLYMAKVAQQAGRLPASMLKQIETLAAKLDKYVIEPEKPALVHGDVWTTNILAKDGKIAGFIDPAIYYGHAEMDLSFSTLFNTFGETFFKRYHEIRPIPDGFFEVRRDLYNLYPLLVHVRLFGGGYVSSVQRIVSRLV
jgi:fructosamine-3-kinase